MQHIPHTNLEEKHVWPDLTGEDIHNCYCRIEPNESRPWGSLNLVAVRRYEALAKELNRELDARDRVTISGVRCRTCNEMLDSEHAEGHACWQEAR